MIQSDAKDRINLFTYGSLMLPSIFERVTGSCPQSLETVLEQWKRVRVHQESYPAAYPAHGEQILGVLWLGLSATELSRIDAFEGDNYTRVKVQVRDPAGQIYPAHVYQWCRDGGLLNEPWDISWFETVGIKDFSNKYLRA